MLALDNHWIKTVMSKQERQTEEIYLLDDSTNSSTNSYSGRYCCCLIKQNDTTEIDKRMLCLVLSFIITALISCGLMIIGVVLMDKHYVLGTVLLFIPPAVSALMLLIYIVVRLVKTCRN